MHAHLMLALYFVALLILLVTIWYQCKLCYLSVVAWKSCDIG